MTVNSATIKQITEKLFYSSSEELWGACKVVIVLGSSACKYRIQKAWELFKTQDVLYILCGGNFSSYTDEIGHTYTEACYMKNYLLKQGIAQEKIFCEENSTNTFENIKNAFAILDGYDVKAPIGIVSAGFHMARVRQLTDKLNASYNVIYIPAYGEHTGKDNWFLNEIGINIVTQEYEKG